MENLGLNVTNRKRGSKDSIGKELDQKLDLSPKKLAHWICQLDSYLLSARKIYLQWKRSKLLGLV